jgi:hypothetical protein
VLFAIIETVQYKEFRYYTPERVIQILVIATYTQSIPPSIIKIIKSRRMRWKGHVARMEEKRNSYRLLVGKPEGNRPLGRPRRRWVDNVRMDLGGVG